VFGTGDSYSPSPTQITFLLAGRLAFVGSELEPFGLMPVTSVQGNIDVGGLKFTAAVRQYAPDMYDGHFVAFRNDVATSDVTKFLARVAQGQVPKVPE
jgi:hypothetical protein